MVLGFEALALQLWSFNVRTRNRPRSQSTEARLNLASAWVEPSDVWFREPARPCACRSVAPGGASGCRSAGPHVVRGEGRAAAERTLLVRSNLATHHRQLNANQHTTRGTQ